MTSEGETYGKAWDTIARLHGRRLLRKRTRDRLVPPRRNASAHEDRTSFTTKMERWMRAHFGKDAIAQTVLDVMATERLEPAPARAVVTQRGRTVQVYDARDVTVTIDGKVLTDFGHR